MKKFLKYTLLVSSLFLFVLGVVVAICWAVDVYVTLGEVIRAELIAVLAVCIIALGVTGILRVIENIKVD